MERRAHQALLKGIPRVARVLMVVVAAALVAGCAGPYLLDNTVQSFSALDGVPAQGGGYRFERLPSQQADPEQPRVEALAEAALARAGIRRDDAAPRYGVQAWRRAQRMLSPWADPYWGGWGPYPYGVGVGVGVGRYHRGTGVGLGFGFPLGAAAEPPWYQREVGLVLRDLASGQVVYETRAVNTGPWLDPDRATAGMFDAALQGFPRPPAGPRRVDLRIER